MVHLRRDTIAEQGVFCTGWDKVTANHAANQITKFQSLGCHLLQKVELMFALAIAGVECIARKGCACPQIVDIGAVLMWGMIGGPCCAHTSSLRISPRKTTRPLSSGAKGPLARAIIRSTREAHVMVFGNRRPSKIPK